MPDTAAPPIPFDNSYARLPAQFYEPARPTPVRAPALIRLNRPLAETLGLDTAWLASDDGIAALAGNAVPAGATPIAQAYAGHQFGGWSPRLGDGRAILLGEVVGADGRRDIQLKGAGVTPFSRFPDGRAALGPVLREYIVSEAMAALGVPTTRALAAVATGETVMRDTPLPGAVLTRVAASHIRVGTFQYFVARGDKDALHVLTDHVIARHYPAAADADIPALALLQAVAEAQAKLVARWMGLGFIHGVMNTDNMSVAGETIDYGPCAFLDTYHPEKVFSSIDQMGRYAYRNQPAIAQWNLAQLASALLPVMAEDPNQAVEAAQAAVDGVSAIYEAAWLAEFRAKLGLRDAREGDEGLIKDLLNRMATAEADFTQTFRALAETDADGWLPPGIAADTAPLEAWRRDWGARLAAEGGSPADRQANLLAKNPAIIPRNHLIEAAIQAAVAGDLAPFHAITEALETPFHAPADSPYRAAPGAGEAVTETFCGT